MAYRVARLDSCGAFDRDGFLAGLLDACRRGFGLYARSNTLNLPASHRLAFRELGLSIGLHAVERLERMVEKQPNAAKDNSSLRRLVENLKVYLPWAERIENFWLESAYRNA